MTQRYACDPLRSRGRRHASDAAPSADAFQRDRDRIVHCTAFRRLVYKTQVFLNHEGDLFRTRLTHSLEVAQRGRAIARELGLDEDLVEAIALAHDLGHTPFGHAGQDALNDCLRAVQADAGFEHNLQSLRVVDALEERFPDFDGLDLSFETREGILKHCSRRHAQRLEDREPGGVGRRFLDGTQPSLEAQLCNLADEVAYNAHDIDDGVRSGLLTVEQLAEVEMFDACRREALAAFPQLEGRRLLFEIIRRMVSRQVGDLVASTRAALGAAAPANVDAVRAAARPLVRFSAPMREQGAQLKRFLHANLYRHPQVVETTDRARRVIADLFAVYAGDEAALPPAVAALPKRHRAIADYIAGMTDRFALREHERLTGQTLFP
ncbi:MAG TPA: deoxyguanosinetriphosphate triphosphohydrolase [Burkholderiaceae bacterium]|jgi:dGTPase|nr:deoxyguanosinetriphosphate triphosphohydrolase [Burkholderiaceae bacterium]